MIGDGRRNAVVELIEAAVLSGAYSSLARDLPDAARGFERLRQKHHERGTALCGQICAAAELDARAAARMPHRDR